MFGFKAMETLKAAEKEGSSAFVALSHDEARSLGSRAKHFVNALGMSVPYSVVGTFVAGAITAAICVATGHSGAFPLAFGVNIGAMIVDGARKTRKDYSELNEASERMIETNMRPKGRVKGLLRARDI